MKGSDYIIRLLEDAGVEVLFHQHGGACAHIVDSAYRRRAEGGPIRPVAMVHEQGCAMAADGYARAAGKPAAVVVTSGPGATNTVTGVACAWYDSIPMIVITGQVPTHHKKAIGARQGGFQETGIVSMLKGITRSSAQITSERALIHVAPSIIGTAVTGRPGPVLLDIPMDVQQADVEERYSTLGRFEMGWSEPHWQAPVASALMRAKRPVIVAGGGIKIAGCRQPFRAWVKRLGAPVVATFGAVDVLPHDSPLFCGVIGSHGHTEANRTLREADLVLAIGARLSLRSMAMESSLPGRVISMNITPSETEALHLCVNVNHVVEWSISNARWPNWNRWKLTRRSAWAGSHFAVQGAPYDAVRHVVETAPDDGIIIGDAGQTVMWTLQGARPMSAQRVFSAHGHSPMGYAIPAAIGAALASPMSAVKVLIGDGGFALNAQELHTIKQLGLNIEITVLNNHGLGAIQDYQDATLEGRYHGSAPGQGYEPVDAVAIARAYGVGHIVDVVDLGDRAEVTMPEVP